MMEKQGNLATWIQKFNDGDFDSRDVQTQIEAGWFDWFCRTYWFHWKSLYGIKERLVVCLRIC